MSEELPARPRPASFPDPSAVDHVTYDPSLEALRSFSSSMETTTEYGSPAYVSDFRSRSADRTRNAVDDEFDPEDYAVLETALSYVRDGSKDLVCVDRRVGRHPDASYTCRLFVPRRYGRIALAWAKLLEPVEASDSPGDEDSTPVDPDFVTVQLPDHDGPRIRVLPEEGVTAVLGSDYTGEAKKSFLRLFMFRAKQQGGLGLHAGSKRVCLTEGTVGKRVEAGDEPHRREVGQVFLGLSGTGKSTLTSHGLWLDDPECAEALQDDVCALLPDGTVAGSEGAGLYVKTIGLDPEEQPEIHRAATDESAVLENVDVADDGTVDFDSDRYTSNSRAVIRREHLEGAADDMDLGRVDQVFFITRNPLMPAIAKLSAEEAAVAFMLGESVETGAGDPDRAGEAVRVVGTNPFIVGSKGAEGNRFRDLVADLDAEAYLLNTGHVGLDDPRDAGVEETVRILEAVARGRVEWERDDRLGLTVPAAVPGVDAAAFDPAGRTDDFEGAVADLRAERHAHLDAFADLDPAIRDALY